MSHSKRLQLVEELSALLKPIPDEANGAGIVNDGFTVEAAPIPDKFCVIGLDAYDRVWHDTPAAAVTHAQELFRTTKLAVVNVVDIVEKVPPQPPPVTIRKPVLGDFLNGKSVRRSRYPDED